MTRVVATGVTLAAGQLWDRAADGDRLCYSGSNGGTCVEVGTTDMAVAVRDGKHPDGPHLTSAAGTWKAFTEVKAAA